MTTVTEYEATNFVQEISEALERHGKTRYFSCHTLYGDRVLAGKASTALAGHLKKTGGYLGRFRVRIDKKRTPHGIRWKAMISPDDHFHTTGYTFK